ncbi:MAG: hemolysin family protein [Spirochaetes bacterium]|nr:hemolysin family protein [Spirochaetota bacterium]
MIEGIEQLADTTVKEVMIPRTDTVFLPHDAAPELIFSTLLESGHSRIPVYQESMDHVVGILYAKDLLAALVGGKPVVLSALVRKAFFVPETKRIDSLLREFKRRRVHIAIVVDEYGGTSGIVCLEDIIEEIVGEIQDEFDNEPEEIIQIGPSAWQCDARLRLDEIDDKLRLGLPSEEFDSLAGYVFELFGRIPEEKESAEAGTARFTIVEMEGHRILTVKIEKLAEVLSPNSGETTA